MEAPKNKCRCCGKEYGPIPAGAWMATIGGWHTVYISTPNDNNTVLGMDNDPAKAADASWGKLKDVNFHLRYGEEHK